IKGCVQEGSALEENLSNVQMTMTWQSGGQILTSFLSAGTQDSLSMDCILLSILFFLGSFQRQKENLPCWIKTTISSGIFMLLMMELLTIVSRLRCSMLHFVFFL
ncbi:hypothetical protein THAOC_00715, partial [Thalassiosira oceanica]